MRGDARRCEENHGDVRRCEETQAHSSKDLPNMPPSPTNPPAWKAAAPTREQWGYYYYEGL